MKILIIGKYPPIEGGTAARTYWLSRMLGEKGHQVSVVTNAPRVEDIYRIPLNLFDPETRREYQPPNVTLFTLDTPPPQHIPYSEGYVSRLVNSGLEAIGKQGADVIFSYYLEPYAVAGLLLKELTGLPLVIQHAGSDIYRILRNKDYTHLMGRVLQNANHLIFAKSLHNFLHSLGIPNSRITPTVRILSPSAFSPIGPKFAFPDIPKRTPVITYLGKTTLNKGLEELFCALTLVPDLRVFLFSNGPLREEFAARIARDQMLMDRVRFMDFVPPWVVPSILRGSDLLLHLEHEFSIPIHSPVQPYEGILTQTPLLLSQEIFGKMEQVFPQTKDLFLTTEPGNREALAGAISQVLHDREGFKKKAIDIYNEFSNYDWRNSVATYENVFYRASRPGLSKRFARFR